MPGLAPPWDAADVDAAVGLVVAEDDAVQEAVAVLLKVEAGVGVVQAPVDTLADVYAVGAAAELLLHVGVDNMRHFVYPVDSTVRLTQSN